MNPKPTRERILKDMRKSVVSFTFTKKDGTDRDMRATLQVSHMPESKIPVSDSNAIVGMNPAPADVIRCFDVDINEWRSFNISSLKYYSGAIDKQ